MPPLLFDSVSIPRVPAEVAYGMAGYDDDMDDSFPAPVVSWATKPVSGGKRRTTSASTFMTGANLESPIAPVVDGNLPVDTPGVGTHPAKVSERTRTSSRRSIRESRKRLIGALEANTRAIQEMMASHARPAPPVALPRPQEPPLICLRCLKGGPSLFCNRTDLRHKCDYCGISTTTVRTCLASFGRRPEIFTPHLFNKN